MKQPHRPEFSEKLFFFSAGIITSVPFPIVANSLINYFLILNFPRFTASVLSIAVFAPFIEEFAKAYPLFFRHGETQKSLMTLAFYTGLGFGIAEFILYVFILGAPIDIRLPALLFHATNTVIVAYGISRNKSFIYYMIAVFLHFLNNISAILNAWMIGGIIAIFLSIALATYFYRRSKEQVIDYWL